MGDIYCFICGLYLFECIAINPKNKIEFAGEQTPENTFKKTNIQGEEVVYNYDGTDILVHEECYDLLKERCKYKLKHTDNAENMEGRNMHLLIAYDGIERPPNEADIKNRHKWKDDVERIIEEWEPVIDEIRTKNKDMKKTKKEALQKKREDRRVTLRLQLDKCREKADNYYKKLQKIETELEKIQKEYQSKLAQLNTVLASDKRKTKKINSLQKSINILLGKIEVKQSKLNEGNVKWEELKEDIVLFQKAWF
jgi:chromosome segregation ATPase